MPVTSTNRATIAVRRARIPRNLPRTDASGLFAAATGDSCRNTDADVRKSAGRRPGGSSRISTDAKAAGGDGRARPDGAGGRGNGQGRKPGSHGRELSGPAREAVAGA